MGGLLGLKAIVFSGDIIFGRDQKNHDLRATPGCRICDGSF